MIGRFWSCLSFLTKGQFNTILAAERKFNKQELKEIGN
jgi:hypothetical protein